MFNLMEIFFNYMLIFLYLNNFREVLILKFEFLPIGKTRVYWKNDKNVHW